MDWRSIDFDWNRARAFLVTAEEGSLSAAARALGTTQPTLGRQVRALEEELGVALFERHGRGLELTPSGLSLLEQVRVMGEAASQLSLRATGQSESVEGSVCISAADVTAGYALPPMIEKLRRLQPGIEIELVASNEASDLRRREADLAIRAFRPTQPDLIGRRLTELTGGLYATPACLQRHGNPTTPSDFREAEFVGFNQLDPFIAMLRERGLTLTRKNFPILCENHLVNWALVKAGAGIGVMLTAIGDAEPSVRRVLPDLEPMVGDLWLVAHRELRTSRRLRVVFDFLLEEFAALAIDGGA